LGNRVQKFEITRVCLCKDTRYPFVFSECLLLLLQQPASFDTLHVKGLRPH
jgi:hypothetical protein